MDLKLLLKDDILNSSVYEILDRLLVLYMEDIRDTYVEQYIDVKNGRNIGAYVVNDLEEDAFQISRRIEAVDFILRDFKGDQHESFDFDSVPWWDDEEGLS